METPCHIELFGGLRVRASDGRTINRFQTRKTAALLAYLAYYPQRSHPRDALVDLHWPDAELAAGRHRLCVAVSSLRRQLEPPGTPTGSVLISNRAFVQLNPTAITTDVAAFEAALDASARSSGDWERAERLAEAAALYRGELLPGCEEAWALLERERLAEAMLAAYGQLIVIAERAGDATGAIQWARRTVTADPLREEGHRELIRLLVGAGEQDAALRQFRELERMLATELAAEPEEKTRSLIAAVACRTAVTPRQNKRAIHPLEPSPPSPASRRLPAPTSRFFGREEEVASLLRLLRSANERLVTVMGPGGSGKSRLAVEAARQYAENRQGAFWFLSLSALAEPGRLPEAMRDGMGLSPSPNMDPLDQVVSVLAQQATLLLLDNVEHLLPEGAGVIRTLLEESPTLTCLVTSRRRLEIEGEKTLMLKPLPTPEAVTGRAGSEQLLSLAQCPSVQLYVDRAQAVRPDFTLTPTNSAAVTTLCRRLEGLPLALELAAARAGVLTPRQMLDQLERPFAFLVRRGPAAERRHGSLWEALTWSYDLLTPDVQRFFAALSAFRGDWDLEAAAEVCEEPRATEFSEQLLECSLILVEEREETMRFRMLETLREYAQEQLRFEERPAVARRHASFYRVMAEEAEPHLRGGDQALWLRRLEAEHDNLRAALDWSRERGRSPDGHREAQEGLSLAAALYRFWLVRGHWSEGRARLSDLLAMPGAAAHTASRARALVAAASLTQSQGDSAAAQTFAEEGLAIQQELGDQQGMVASLNHLGNLTTRKNEHEAARVLFSQSLAISRDLDYKHGIAWSLFGLGNVTWYIGESRTARGLHEECLALWREMGDKRCISLALNSLGYLAIDLGDYAAAEAVEVESLAIHRELGDRSLLAASLRRTGVVAGFRGNYEQARALLKESLDVYEQLGDRGAAATALVSLGHIAVCTGDYRRAQALCEQCLAIQRALDFDLGMAVALCGLGTVACYEGDHSAARTLYEESLAIGRALNEGESTACALNGLGLLAETLGDDEAALSLHQESLTLRRAMGNSRYIAESLERLAGVAGALGNLQRSARLFGAVQALRDAMGAPLPANERAGYEQRVRATRAALGDVAFAAAWAAGQSLPLEEAIAEGLQQSKE